MWKEENFIVANGFTQFNNPKFANDLSPYEYFDGDLGENIDMEFSDARGRRRKRKPNRQLTKKEAIARREKRRSDKLALKNKEIETQKEIVDKALKSQDKDSTILSQLGLSNNTNLPEVSPNKPNNKTIYWVVGGLAVATIVGVILYKKSKK